MVFCRRLARCLRGVDRRGIRFGLVSHHSHESGKGALTNLSAIGHLDCPTVL